MKIIIGDCTHEHNLSSSEVDETISDEEGTKNPSLKEGSMETKSISMRISDQVVVKFGVDCLYTGRMTRSTQAPYYEQHGYGALKFPVSDARNTYIGLFVGGNFNGHGVMVFCNGDSYNGSFVNNRMKGIGRLQTASSSFHGNFLHDLRHGPGTEKFSSNEVYEGEYFLGKRHGEGMLTF